MCSSVKSHLFFVFFAFISADMSIPFGRIQAVLLIYLMLVAFVYVLDKSFFVKMLNGNNNLTQIVFEVTSLSIHL